MSKEKLASQFNNGFKAYLSQKWYKRITKILKTTKNTFSVFITVQCLEATLLGILCIIGMLIFKIPYAITVGVFIGVTALIPVVGAFLGIIIGIILILAVEPLKVLPFIALVNPFPVNGGESVIVPPKSTPYGIPIFFESGVLKRITPKELSESTLYAVPG